MNRTMIYVSSVTNTMRGKALLERQGFFVSVQRSDRSTHTDGCGYRLEVGGNKDTAIALLKNHNIRVLRTEERGDNRGVSG